jgi:hypothetical protein
MLNQGGRLASTPVQHGTPETHNKRVWALNPRSTTTSHPCTRVTIAAYSCFILTHPVARVHMVQSAAVATAARVPSTACST